MRTLLTVGVLLGTLASAPSAQTRSLLGDDLRLLQITVGEAVTYDFEIDGEARTLTYATPRRGAVEARVTDKEGRELVAVVASRRGTTTRVNGGRVRLREGQSLYKVRAVDASSVWLLRQNYARSECLGLEWLQEVTADANGGELLPSTQSLLGLPVGLLDGIIGIIGGNESGGSCTATDAQCAEEDIYGNTELIVYECDCGIAMCTPQQITVAVPYVYMQDGELRSETEYVTSTRCLCGCLIPVGSL